MWLFVCFAMHFVARGFQKGPMRGGLRFVVGPGAGCGLSEQSKAVMRDYDVQCTDFVEHFRADVDTRDMNLAKLQAVAELLDAELDREWIGHVVLMDYDMLLLKASAYSRFDIVNK